jgi:sec-independent protein translocase protein TatA
LLGLDNPIHIAFLLVLLLLVFGAKRLPEMGRSMGAGLRGFKESISGEDNHATEITAAQHQPVAAPAVQPEPVRVEEQHETPAESAPLHPAA